ncbi:MAG: ATP-binding protein [Campylobacterales bacterium]|nr:ATP-binding protein [Campylobacterales bacterium]
MISIEQVDRVLEAFTDREDNKYYVPLDTTRFNYSKLNNSLKNPFKIILIYGPPGSGKSFLMQKFYDEHRENHPMFLYKTPSFDKGALCHLYKELTKKELDVNQTESLILEAFRENIKEEVIIMLDEAQLYNSQQMEWIRLLSNEPYLKFIISLHKIDEEEVIAQQHFQTRIFETINTEAITYTDLKNYVEQKIILANGESFLAYFTKTHFKLIFMTAKGNLRNINRLMSRFFLFYKMLIEQSQVMSINDSKKYLEMAALDLKMIEENGWFRRLFQRWM